MIVPVDEVTLRAMLLGAYGHDDLGVAQTKVGDIDAVADTDGLATYTIDTHGLVAKEPINVNNTTSYNGPQKVVSVVDADTVIVNKAYVADETGDFDKLGGQGSWIGFMPMGADLVPDNDIATLSFKYPDIITGDPKLVEYLKGIFYPFGGIITTVLMGANNIRLIRWGEDLS